MCHIVCVTFCVSHNVYHILCLTLCLSHFVKPKRLNCVICDKYCATRKKRFMPFRPHCTTHHSIGHAFQAMNKNNEAEKGLYREPVMHGWVKPKKVATAFLQPPTTLERSYSRANKNAISFWHWHFEYIDCLSCFVEL